MSKIRNILFIMCDQLRADYLGCNVIRTSRRETSTGWPPKG